MNRRTGRPPLLLDLLVEKIEITFVKGKKAGERLPTEKELSRQFGVNHNTVRSALAELEKKRLIQRKPHAGAFVAPPAVAAMREHIGRSLGVLFPTPYGWIRTRFYQDICAVFLQELSQSGINLTLCPYNYRHLMPFHTPATHLGHPDILGLLLVGQHQPGVIESVMTIPKPCVAIDVDATAQNIDSFIFDNAGAGALLARRLYKLGHRRIVAVFEDPKKPRRDEAWTSRREGFMSALKDLADVRFTPLYTPKRTHLRAILPAFGDLLDQAAGKRPTAVCLPHEGCFADVSRMATEKGLKIPRDLSVVVFGEVGNEGAPTGVHFDGAKLAQAGLLHLLRGIRDPKWEARKAHPQRFLTKGVYVAGKTHRSISGRRTNPHS